MNRILYHMTPIEFGAANIILLAQLADCSTEKQEQRLWLRLQAAIRNQLCILQPHRQVMLKGAKLISISKHYEPNKSKQYITAWEVVATDNAKGEI